MPQERDDDLDPDLGVEFDDATEEEVEDPLGDLDATERTRIEALIEQQTAARLATAEAALQADFDNHKKSYNRRLDAGRKNLTEQFGIDLDNDGNAVFRDPTKLAQAALGLGGRAAQRTEADPLDAPIDFSEEPEALNEKFKRMVQSGVQEALKPIMTELQTLRGVAGAAASMPLRDVVEIARRELEADGIGHLSDHADFSAELMDTVQKRVPPEQWGDPNAIYAAATLVGATLRRNAPERVTKRTQADRDAQAAALHRGSLAGTGASRGGGRESGGFTAVEVEEAGLLGMSPAEYRALGEDMTGDRYFAVRDKQQRRQGAAR